MFCTHCGTRLDKGCCFCPVCGQAAAPISPHASLPRPGEEEFLSAQEQRSTTAILEDDGEWFEEMIGEFFENSRRQKEQRAGRLFWPLLIGGIVFVLSTLVFCGVLFDWYTLLPFWEERPMPLITAPPIESASPAESPLPAESARPAPSASAFVWEDIVALSYDGKLSAFCKPYAFLLCWDTYGNTSVYRVDEESGASGEFLRFSAEDIYPYSIAVHEGYLYLAAYAYLDSYAYYRVPVAGGELEFLFAEDSQKSLYSGGDCLYLLGSYTSLVGRYDPATGKRDEIPLLREDGSSGNYSIYGSACLRGETLTFIAYSGDGMSVYACDLKTGLLSTLYDTAKDIYHPAAINSFYCIDDVYWLDISRYDSTDFSAVTERLLLRHDPVIGISETVANTGDRFGGLITAGADCLYFYGGEEPYLTGVGTGYYEISRIAPYEISGRFPVKDFNGALQDRFLYDAVYGGDTLSYLDGGSLRLSRAELGAVSEESALGDTWLGCMEVAGGTYRYDYAHFAPAYGYVQEDESYVYLLLDRQGTGGGEGDLYRVSKEDLREGWMQPELLCRLGDEARIHGFGLANYGDVILSSSYGMPEGVYAYYLLETYPEPKLRFLSIGEAGELRSCGGTVYLLCPGEQRIYRFKPYHYGEVMQVFADLGKLPGEEGGSAILPYFSPYKGYFYYIRQGETSAYLSRYPIFEEGAPETVLSFSPGEEDYVTFTLEEGLSLSGGLRLRDGSLLYPADGEIRTRDGAILGTVEPDLFLTFTGDYIFSSRGFAPFANLWQWAPLRNGGQDLTPPPAEALQEAERAAERLGGTEGGTEEFILSVVLLPDSAYELIKNVSVIYTEGDMLIEWDWHGLPEGNHTLVFYNHGAQAAYRPDNALLATLLAFGEGISTDGLSAAIRIPYDLAYMLNDFYISVGIRLEGEDTLQSFVINPYFYP